jgi:hypothetical protein
MPLVLELRQSSGKGVALNASIDWWTCEFCAITELLPKLTCPDGKQLFQPDRRGTGKHFTTSELVAVQYSVIPRPYDLGLLHSILWSASLGSIVLIQRLSIGTRVAAGFHSSLAPASSGDTVDAFRISRSDRNTAAQFLQLTSVSSRLDTAGQSV